MKKRSFVNKAPEALVALQARLFTCSLGGLQALLFFEK